jgi:hypothetical protein
MCVSAACPRISACRTLFCQPADQSTRPALRPLFNSLRCGAAVYCQRSRKYSASFRQACVTAANPSCQVHSDYGPGVTGSNLFGWSAHRLRQTHQLGRALYPSETGHHYLNLHARLPRGHECSVSSGQGRVRLRRSSNSCSRVPSVQSASDSMQASTRLRYGLSGRSPRFPEGNLGSSIHVSEWHLFPEIVFEAEVRA